MGGLPQNVLLTYNAPVMRGRTRIPYFGQLSPVTCGAACLKMVLAGFKIESQEDQLARDARTGPEGTALEDLIDVARANGLQTETFTQETALGQLENAVGDGRPVIAIVSDLLLGGDLSGRAHFVVVTVTDGEYVYFHDPENGPDRRVPRERFLLSWTHWGFRGVALWK